MIKTINIGEIQIKLKPIDFNAMCELEELGFVPGSKATMSAIRGLLAYHMDITAEDAGNLIQKHIANDGKIDDFIVLLNHLYESDFFMPMLKKAEKK